MKNKELKGRKRRMKKVIRSFIKVSAIVLAFIMLVSMAEITPIQAASGDSIKAVYTVKQLKKAMKAKAAATIVFRSESVDPVTIPSVKNSKNKELIVNAPNMNIKNKSKFKSITVNSVKNYTEAVSGNSIIWNDIDEDLLIVAKGKSVNKVTFTNWLGINPNYIVRKGAKIKSVEFVSLNHNKGKTNTKKRTAAIEGQAATEELGDYYKAVYSFDKSWRIIKSEVNSAYNGNTVTTYKYDKNGNRVTTEITQPGDIVSTSTREYNSDNALINIFSTDNSGEESSVHYEYDDAGRMILYAVRYPDGNDMYNMEYKYDKKGRLIENYFTPYDTKDTYSYDSAGRCIEKTSDKRGDVSTLRYTYDKNGLLVKTVEESSEGMIYVQEYVHDFLGNNIYSVYKNTDKDGYADNSSRYGYMLNEYSGEYPVYEDGFESPVNDEPFDKKSLEESGFTVVSSTEELIEAIAPGAGIIIAPGTYNMSEYIEKQDRESFNRNHKYVQINDCVDGNELVVKDADYLMISGGTGSFKDTSLVIDPRYSAVFRFENCDGLQLNSFTCGHTEKGNCEGNVIDLYNCKSVGIYGMDIFGCGVYGIGAFNGSGNIKVYNSVIHDCEFGFFIYSVLEGKVTFTNCLFYGSNGGAVWYSDEKNNSQITFTKCSFGEGETNSLTFNEVIDTEDCLWSEVTWYPEYD